MLSPAMFRASLPSSACTHCFTQHSTFCWGAALCKEQALRMQALYMQDAGLYVLGGRKGSCRFATRCATIGADSQCMTFRKHARQQKKH
eukprot:1605262-Amphidinium_carterae.1